MSDSKPTYFPIYCERFVVEMQLMTAEELGAYMCLKVNAWLQNPPCTLPSDARILQKLANTGRGRWATIGPRVMSKFRLENDRYMCDELREEYQKSLKRMEVSRKNGAFGGRPPNNPAGSRQVSGGLAAGNPELTQSKPIDKDKDKDNEKDKEPEPHGGPRKVIGQSEDAFTSTIEPDPDATWMIRAVAKAIGYQLSSSQQYEIISEQAGLVSQGSPMVGGKPVSWQDVFDAACTVALQKATNKAPLPFTRYAISIAKGVLSDGIMPGHHKPADNGKLQPGPVLTGNPYKPFVRRG